MKRFSETYEHFEGPAIEEFINVSETVYKEWHYWKDVVKRYIPELPKSFSEVWKEFKDYW